MSEFWTRVTDMMARCDLSMPRLSQKIGKGPRTVEGWKTHDVIPKADDAYKMAVALGVSVEEMVTGRLPSILARGGDRANVYGVKQSDVIAVPFLEVKEEHGKLVIDFAEGYGSHTCVSPTIVRGLDINRLSAIVVGGDEMTEAGINSGDVVICDNGNIGGNGVYVARLADHLVVRIMEFKPVGRQVQLSPANKIYSPIVLDASDNSLQIVGRVVAHIHRYHI